MHNARADPATFVMGRGEGGVLNIFLVIIIFHRGLYNSPPRVQLLFKVGQYQYLKGRGRRFCAPHPSPSGSAHEHVLNTSMFLGVFIVSIYCLVDTCIYMFF